LLFLNERLLLLINQKREEREMKMKRELRCQVFVEMALLQLVADDGQSKIAWFRVALLL